MKRKVKKANRINERIHSKFFFLNGIFIGKS